MKKYVFLFLCFLVIVFAALFLYGLFSPPPILTLEAPGVFWMGAEVYQGYRSDDFADGYELDCHAKKLPVYENLDCIYGSYSENMLESEAREYAKKLGFEVLEQRKKYDIVDRIILECGEGTIEVFANGNVSVKYKEGVSLPFTIPARDMSENQIEDTMQYLSKEYAAIFGMKKPQYNPYITYRPSGKKWNKLELFEFSGTPADQMINREYNKIIFAAPEGKLERIEYVSPKKLKEKGKYEIIDEAAAWEKLFNKEYFSISASVYSYEISKENVKKVELKYWHYEGGNEYIMPFYVFYLELPLEREPSGLNSYVKLWVPAVKEKYISNLSVLYNS